MRYTIFILSLLFPFLSIVAQPKHEVRAAWVTAVYGLDWPRTRATTPQTIRKQKEELIDILDKLKAANFNTILFQTRTRGDVLYPSAIEPFNSRLELRLLVSTNKCPIRILVPISSRENRWGYRAGCSPI